MLERWTAWRMVPRPVRNLPADLAVVLVVVVATNVAALAPVIRETPLRIPLGLAFVLFVPGYVFVATLFPESGESPTAEQVVEERRITEESNSDSIIDRFDRTGIDGIERVALSFGLSLAIVPLIGLALNFTPWGIRLVPIMVALSGFVVVTTVAAAVRRWELPPEERFEVPYKEWYVTGRTELLEPNTRADILLNVLLILSVLLAIGSVAFAVMPPLEEEGNSAVYVLTEDDDGELVAAGYPSEIELGESAEIVVGVDNHEHRTVEYEVVVLEQRVGTEGNESVVQEQRELDRFETILENDESWHYAHDVEPMLVGEDIRIVWLLFPDGEAPAEPSMDDTEYSVYIWVDIVESEE